MQYIFKSNSVLPMKQLVTLTASPFAIAVRTPLWERRGRQLSSLARVRSNRAQRPCGCFLGCAFQLVGGEFLTHMPIYSLPWCHGEYHSSHPVVSSYQQSLHLLYSRRALCSVLCMR